MDKFSYRIPTERDRIFKDEALFSFDSPVQIHALCFTNQPCFVLISSLNMC